MKKLIKLNMLIVRKKKTKSIDHLVPSFSLLTSIEYKEIYWKVDKNYGILDYVK